MTITISNKLISASVFAVFGRMKTFALIVLGMIMLGNKVSLKVWGLAITSIFGITLVVSPGIYGFADEKGLKISWTPLEIVGLITTMVFLLCDSMQSVLMIRMAGSISPHQSIFWIYVVAALMNGLLLGATPFQKTYKWFEYLYALPFALIFYFGAIMYNQGGKYEKNSGVMALITVIVAPISMAIIVLVFGQAVTLINVVGCLVVCTCCAVAMTATAPIRRRY